MCTPGNIVRFDLIRAQTTKDRIILLLQNEGDERQQGTKQAPRQNKPVNFVGMSSIKDSTTDGVDHKFRIWAILPLTVW